MAKYRVLACYLEEKEIEADSMKDAADRFIKTVRNDVKVTSLTVERV